MKAISILVGSVLVLANASATVTIASAKTPAEILSTGTAEEKGQAVAQELALRNAGYKDLGGDVEMVLRDGGGGEAKRRFSLKVLEKPVAAAGDYSLIVFDTPADVKGTAVLSHAKVGDEDDQWLYLPAVKRVKRISSSNRTGSFVGSEFSFEDLTGNEGRKYSWKLLGVETCSNQSGAAQCFTVEAAPKDASSAYSRRVLHIDTVEMRVASIDFYDRKDVRIKTLAYDDYKKLDNKFWRAQSWTMKNHQSGKSTLLTFTSMRLGNGYSVSDFSTGKLGN